MPLVGLVNGSPVPNMLNDLPEPVCNQYIYITIDPQLIIITKSRNIQ